MWFASCFVFSFIFCSRFSLAIFGCTRNSVGKLYIRALKSLCAIRRSRSTPRCSTLLDANKWAHHLEPISWMLFSRCVLVHSSTTQCSQLLRSDNNHKPPSRPPPPKCYRKKYAFLHASRFLPLSWRAPFSVISAFHQHRASRQRTVPGTAHTDDHMHHRIRTTNPTGHIQLVCVRSRSKWHRWFFESFWFWCWFGILCSRTSTEDTHVYIAHRKTDYHHEHLHSMTTVIM